MQLIQLVITRADKLVRSITFKNGLNLILDKPTQEATQSGNNVGKTTVLRLIDYCLGSDGEDIWQDPEFKKNINQEVYDYLHGNFPVAVALTVGDEKLGHHEIKRIFPVKKKPWPLFTIDGVNYKNITEFRAAVKKLLFGADGAKPTVRQLAPKFVRSSQTMMSRTLKFSGDFSSEVDYEALHLFLFGFLAVHVLEERPRLMRLKKKLDRDLQALSRTRKEGEIEQLLLHLRREVEDIGLSNQLRGEVPEIAAHANEVSAIRARAANLAGRLGRLESEIAAINMTIDELESEYSDIDRQAIEGIYRDAGKYIPELHHSWEELTDFVQSLRGRKQKFLSQQAQALRNRAQETEAELLALQSQESHEIGTLMKSRAFEQALEVRADLQEKLKKLGSLEQDLQDIKNLKTEISNTEKRLKETQEEIEEGKALLGKRVGIFNKYFSELSKALYGEQYLLHYDATAKGSLSFELTAVGSNVGAGKKMSQTAAFDMAYIRFLRETGIKFPTFVCHDGMESIHANQLAALLTMANSIDGQLILATLRDKLPVPPLSEEFIIQNTVLELSQEDKLFHI